MADLIVADGQYEAITADQTLIAVEGKLYYRRNNSAGNITITYGPSTMILNPDDLGIFLYDGTDWSDLTPKVEGGDVIVDTLQVLGSTTISSSGLTSSSSSIDLLKNTTITGNSTFPLVAINNTTNDGLLLGGNTARSFIRPRTSGVDRSSSDLMYYESNDFWNFETTLVVGAGISNGTDLLQVGSDSDISVSMGKGKLGYNGSSLGAFVIGHNNFFNASEYTMAITEAGGLRLNSVAGQTTYMKVGNVDIASFGASSIELKKNTTIIGSLSKSSGSFRIPHPLKPETHELVHSFVEAPQADNIYRGKVDLVDGKAIVNINEVAGMSEGTFRALNREVQVFTTNESGWNMVRGSVEGNILTIETQTKCIDSISWMVIGERHDEHMYDTAWTDEQGKVIVEPEIKTKEEENT